MGKLKKGDRVKAITDGLDYKAGNEFVLTRDGDDDNVYFVDNAGDERMRPQEEVEILPIAEAAGTTESQPNSLTIEAGKYYRTRDGRKVGPMEKWHLGGWHADRAPVPLNGGLWNDSGTAWFDNSNDSPALIAEWVDETVVATEPTQPVAATEPRRFKIGDKVRAIVDFLWVKAGQEYDVTYLDNDGDVWLRQGGHEAFMTDDELELITPAEEPFKLTCADGRTVLNITHGVLTMEVAQTDVPASPSSDVTLKISLDTAEITDAIKSTLLRTKQGYGFEIARHGDYVWVDTGQKAPLVFKAADVQAAA